MDNFHITVIVNAHREGLLAQPTLFSLEQSANHARRNGIQIEVVLVLDRPDPVTLELFGSQAQAWSDATVHVVDNGDLGRSRNNGVAVARGNWLAFLDADDLWSANWLSEAYHAASHDPRVVVWHPEVNLYFGIRKHIFLHVDMDDPNYEPLGLAITNYWTSLCLAPRPLLLDIPYPETNLEGQIGYEDWAWNMKVIAGGALHKVVPLTGHAIRIKESSLLKQTSTAGCIPHPSELFRQMILVDQAARCLGQDCG